MLTAILIIVGIANLAVMSVIYIMLVRIGREVNQIEKWKHIPVTRFF